MHYNERIIYGVFRDFIKFRRRIKIAGECV